MKRIKSPYKLLSNRGLTEAEILFIILYVVCGYTQVEAYSTAFNTKAKQGLPSLACHLLATRQIKDAAQLLAEYVQENGVVTPTKYHYLNNL